MSRVREAAKPELCTQAWCKFHEILATFRLVEDFADGMDFYCTTIVLIELKISNSTENITHYPAICD